MRVKTTITYHFTPIRMAIIKKTVIRVGENRDKLDNVYTADGNVNGTVTSGNTLRAPHMEYEPTILLLGTYPREKKTSVHAISRT